jgi:predicted CoA-binding protein
LSDLATEELRRIYEETSTVAVVGCSADPEKPAHRVPRYIQGAGYRIVPVNPREETILGERAYDSLQEVDLPIDLVVVFRPAEEAPKIAADAVAIGARTLWLQEGIVSEQARRIADEGGLAVAMDMCVGETHGELGLGPGP